ncbi:TetR/AcrR family transcriptional regulator [Amycolatopsis sp. H20-H5]|uniref:TetR/AcrR family transcriptional regulator n=1 Tax=Amycolatopsis sp. H20-H5 TaxID=3046309 RepID=UPI002DBA1059|nr:helix-turn-helix domain-containing protein [Amycolatopsis sp. H20-H5]MEC3975160.1 helix-turn-helix domain-containing protein [Amycolatopsis sp. H20-H5]
MAAKRLTREESRERTRDRLLVAAAELFAERGVNGTSVEQIAERAGYTRGAFYGNFEGKPELVAALLRQRTRQEAEEVAALRAGAGSFAETMDRLRVWNAERARHLDQWFALRTELSLYALRNPEARPIVGESEAATRLLIESAVSADFARREVTPPADPAFLALIVHALEDGLLLQRFLSPEGTSDEVVVDAVQLLMRAWTALSAAESP